MALGPKVAGFVCRRLKEDIRERINLPPKKPIRPVLVQVPEIRRVQPLKVVAPRMIPVPIEQVPVVPVRVRGPRRIPQRNPEEERLLLSAEQQERAAWYQLVQVTRANKLIILHGKGQSLVFRTDLGKEKRDENKTDLDVSKLPKPVQDQLMVFQLARQ
jgi:hypothetical protein